MDNNELQAKLLANDAALKAILLTRNDPSQLFVKFTELWTEVVRDLNKKSAESADNAPLAKALSAECNLLSQYFR